MAAEYVAHKELRRLKTESVLLSYMETDSPIADQGKVWAEVERKLLVSETPSPTVDEAEFYERHKMSIEDLLQPIKPISYQVGAVIAIGEEVMGLEAFDHPETWEVLHGKVLRSYAADALEVLWWRKEKGQLLSGEKAKAFVMSVSETMEGAIVKKAPIGLGEHYLLDGRAKKVKGFALVHEGTALHLFAFPSEN